MPAMLRSERDRQIVRILHCQGSASAAALADRLRVSRATIRRDLERLEQTGALTRVYGGATVSADSATPPTPSEYAVVPTSDTRTSGNGPATSLRIPDGSSDELATWPPYAYAEEEPFTSVTDTDAEAKERLAVAAASLVSDGDVLLLDIGTTVFRLARHLHGRAVTVITSNMAVFDELRDDPEVQLVLLGGVYRPNYRTLVGSLTETVLEHVSAEWLFLSCTGVRGDGQVVDDIQAEATVKRSMIAAAESVVLLAHHGKFPGRGPWRVCGLTDVDMVITTEATEREWLDPYERANGKVLLA